MYMYTCMYTSLSQNRSFSFNPLKKKKDRFWDRLMYTMYTIHIHIRPCDHIYLLHKNLALCPPWQQHTHSSGTSYVQCSVLQL